MPYSTNQLVKQAAEQSARVERKDRPSRVSISTVNGTANIPDTGNQPLPASSEPAILQALRFIGVRILVLAIVGALLYLFFGNADLGSTWHTGAIVLADAEGSIFALTTMAKVFVAAFGLVFIAAIIIAVICTVRAFVEFLRRWN